MEKAVEFASRWLVESVRDSSLKRLTFLINRPMGIDGNVQASGGAEVDRKRLEAFAAQSVDLALSILLVEIDRMRTAGSIRVSVRERDQDAWVLLDDRHPTHELYEDWVEQFSRYSLEGRLKEEGV